VRAIVVSDEALAERRSETVLHCISRLSPAKSASISSALRTDEEIFLAQLFRRAQLLNKGFQTAVIQVIRVHEVPDSKPRVRPSRRYDANGSITRVQSGPVSHEPQEHVVVSIGFDTGAPAQMQRAQSTDSPFMRTQSAQSAAGWGLSQGNTFEELPFRRTESLDSRGGKLGSGQRRGTISKYGDSRFERDSSVISDNAVPIKCQFENDVGIVEVHPAAVKRCCTCAEFREHVGMLR
jgi:hypothetical protein